MLTRYTYPFLNRPKPGIFSPAAIREDLASFFDLAEQEFLYFIEQVIEENAKGGRTRVRSVAA
jgi:hypothetical protein